MKNRYAQKREWKDRGVPNPFWARQERNGARPTNVAQEPEPLVKKLYERRRPIRYILPSGKKAYVIFVNGKMHFCF